jgi:hypothetical protein
MPFSWTVMAWFPDAAKKRVSLPLLIRKSQLFVLQKPVFRWNSQPHFTSLSSPLYLFEKIIFNLCVGLNSLEEFVNVKCLT